MVDKVRKISLLQKASRSFIKYDPVPHIIIKNCLDKDYYDLLEKSYVSDEHLLQSFTKKKNTNPGQNSRVNILFSDIYHKNVQWKNSEVWEEFVNYHLSNNFFKDVLNLFAPEIKTICPQLETRIGSSLEKVTVRPYEKQVVYDHENSKSIFLDGDIGINTVSNITSSVRKFHVDGMQKIFAGLLYFKKENDLTEGGDLEFYRWKYDKSPTIHKSVELNKNDLEFVSRVKYEANTAVFWINSPNAIHNVTPRQASKISRRLVYFSGRVDDKTLFYKGLYTYAWPEQEPWFKRIYKDLNSILILFYYRIKQKIKKLTFLN